MFGGFNTGKRPYIVLSGDTTMDAFNLFHEHAHNIPQLLNAISSMLRDGWISKREYNAYKNSRKRRRAANLGIPVSEVSEESEQTIRTEFACDMLGVYAMQAFCNEDHWSAYGIDAETIGSIKQTLDEALAAGAITETDAETAEREFSTLEEAGRAITEAEAKGYRYDISFSENMQLERSKSATRDESLSIEMTDERNIARYQAEINDVLNGTFPSWQEILVGKPPKILSQQMDSDAPLYMAQSAALKAALPATEKKGKHGLGDGVLYQLPYQLADPMAITGNTSRHTEFGDNSIVVWTDWKTGTGDSVIVPIRICVKGNIDVYNNINTIFDAYDEKYVADLLRKGNILYTRNNKDIGELLSQRREVPKSHSSDVFINSIREKAKEYNQSAGSSQFDFSENAPNAVFDSTVDEIESMIEGDFARGEPFMFSENWTEVYPSSSIEYKNRNEYSPYMQKTIIEYLSSVDPKIVQFVNSVLLGNDPKPISLKPISEELGNDIAQILGWNPTGFKAELDAKQVRHLRQDHGLGGVKLAHAADMTMSDSNDVARIQYIIDTYDVVQFGGLTRAYSEPRNDGTDRPRRAETIVIGKRVDSMFYVVEAIPNTAAKTVKFVTSFMQTDEGKNKGAIPLPDAENAPRSTSKNESEPTPTIIIKDREDEFNRKNQNFSDWISIDDGSFSFSENAPTKKQERLKKAWELLDDGATPQDYYAESGSDFDLKTNNLLRGLMLRNGENVGGTLADDQMERVLDIFGKAKKRFAVGMTLSSPVRIFEDVTGWGGSTAEERANNIKDGNFLKNTYYEYGNVQAANREAWIAEKMR